MSSTLTQPELPKFAPLKTVKKKERKKGGIPWFPGADGSAVTLLSVLGSKVGMLAVITALSATAIQYGNEQAQSHEAEIRARRAAGPGGPHRPVARYDGDLSNLPGRSVPVTDSLGMINGGLGVGMPSGTNPAGSNPSNSPGDSGAAGQTQAAAPEGAGAEAAPQAPTAPESVATVVPTAAALAGQRIGSLSSRGGGASTLAGGAGMSAGIGRAFTQLSAAKALRAMAMRGQASPGRVAASRPSVRSRGRGIAERQLTRSAQYSGAARSGTDENRAVNATAAFDNAKGAGSAIAGAGAGTGGAITGDPAETPTNSNPTPGGPADDGSLQPTPTCGAGTHIENGVCMPDQSENVTKWQPLVDAAWNLVKIAGILMIAAFVFGLLAKANIPYVSWIAYYIAKICYIGAMIAGATAAVLGLYIAIGHGQWMQGLILTAIGGLIAYLAYQASEGLVNPAASAAPEPIAEAAAGELAAETDSLVTTPAVEGETLAGIQ